MVRFCFMTESKQSELIAAAEKAIQYAQAVRSHHARRSKPNNKQRRTDIKLALVELSAAMRPIRRRIARLPYLREDGEALKSVSQDLQRERRKLWKMTNTKKGRR